MIDLAPPPSRAHAAESADPETSWRFAAGDELAPGRHVLTLLGGGERYEAYLVWDDRLHTPVVAKVLRPHMLDDERARSAMAREARALTELAHPALVRAFDVRLDDARPHLLLEHLDGPRLSTLIRRYGPLASEQLVPLGRALASALAYMADEGWVHLDVKPRNIVMVAAPRLIDLSLARPLDDARRITGVVGTTGYMAPEQCDPDRFAEIGPKADVWAVGATLYEAATGTPVGPRTDISPPMPAKLPVPLAELLRAALADRPADRPTAPELDARLAELGDWAYALTRRLR